MKNEKIIVSLLVAICLVSAFAIAIPVTTAKKYSKETKVRRSDNPLLYRLDEEEWFPIVPPEPSEALQDREFEEDMEVFIYDVKTKKVKNITKTKKDSVLEFPENQGLLTSELFPESVIPPDDRVRITPTTSYPWSSIVKLFIIAGDGTQFIGTGFIIDGSHILTAGHCVYMHDHGGWALSIEVVPAFDGGYDPFYHAWTTSMTVNGWWYDYGWYTNDFAILTLDRNVGFFTGWMGLEYAEPSASIYTDILNTAGYPGDLDGGWCMYWDSDLGAGADLYNHWYYMDTYGGQSGSPVWYYDGISHSVLSIHAYGSGWPLYPNSNMGTKFNEGVFDTIDYALTSPSPEDFANLIDDGQYYSGFDPVSVTAGLSNFDVWSDIRNIGTAYSGVFYVSYYASTDTEITASDYLIGVDEVPSITPFTWTDSDWSGTFPNIPAGNYYVGWIIDSTNIVDESRDYGEYNNVAYKSSYQLNVIAINLSPVADAGGPYSGMVGSAISFDGTYSYDPDGTIVSYDWDFDGEVGTGATVSHTYDSVGTYTATLTVTDNEGATDIDTVTVTVIQASAGLSIDYVMTTDYVERDWGEYGDTMVVLGSGVVSGVAVNLYWDYAVGPSAYLLNATLGNSDGTFEVCFDVPEAVNGSHYLWVKDTETAEYSRWGPFTVVPSITFDVENGPVGKVVTVSGRGFKEGMVDNITLNGVPCTLIGAIAIDELGTFTGSFVIPSVENLGTYEITLTDINGLEANRDFLITGLANISIDPNYGPPGDNVSIHGYNFSALSGEEVVVKILAEPDFILAIFDTNANGEFSGFFIIPAIAFDDYLVLATQDQYNINATCDLRIGLTAIIISPASGPTGTQVQISGIGFTPEGEWNATIGDMPIFTNETASSEGTIEGIFFVPALDVGTYDITVLDVETEIEIIYDDFVVTATTEVYLDPVEAPNEYNVSLKGYHFADIVGAVDFVIYNSTDERVMNVWQNGAGTEPAETNVDGNFTGWWMVLPKADLSLGDYMVNVTGSEGLFVQVPFSVVEDRVDVAPRKAQFDRGDTVQFDIMSDFKYPDSYIEIYDPSDILYWQTDVLDTWLKVEGLYTVPYYTQTSGGNPMLIAPDAPLGTWLYRFYKDADTELMNGTFTVNPLIPPLPPILENLTITPPEIELGESVTISLDIKNNDSQAITYIVTMQIGEITLTINVELEPYESKTVSHTITPDAVGEYNVTVDGLMGSFTVTERTFYTTDYLLFNLGHSNTFNVSDDDLSNCTVEMVFQNSTEDNYLITLTKIGEEGGFWCDSAIYIGEHYGFLTAWGGAPVGNQANFFWLLHHTPANFSDGDTWNHYYYDVSYEASYVGEQTINDVSYSDCLLLKFDSTSHSNTYLQGIGEAYLAKDVGIIKFTFNKTDGNNFTATLEEHSDYAQRRISGYFILDSDSPAWGYSVGLSNAVNVGYDATLVEVNGSYSLLFYGSSVIIRYGPIGMDGRSLMHQHSQEEKINGEVGDIVDYNLTAPDIGLAGPLEERPPEIIIWPQNVTIPDSKILFNGRAISVNEIKNVSVNGELASGLFSGIYYFWQKEITLTEGMNDIQITAYDNGTLQKSSSTNLWINYEKASYSGPRVEPVPLDVLPENRQVLTFIVKPNGTGTGAYLWWAPSYEEHSPFQHGRSLGDGYDGYDGITITYDIADRDGALSVDEEIDYRVHVESSGYWASHDVITITVGSPDYSPPLVESVSPMPEEQYVLVNSSIDVFFNEQLNHLTLTPDNILLDNEPFEGEIEYDFQSHKMTLLPGDPFQQKSKISIELTSGITDYAGNNLTAYSWDFYTYGRACVSIGSVVIALGQSTDVPLNMSHVTKVEGLGFELYWDPAVINITGIRLSDYLSPSTNNLYVNITKDLGNATVALVNTNAPDYLTWKEARPILIVEIKAVGLHGDSSILNLTNVELSTDWTDYPPDFVIDGLVTIQDQGSIHGYVTYSHNGTPMEGATVELSRYGSTLKTSVTGVNGEYDFLALPLGEYNLTASHERIQVESQYTTFWNASASANVTSGETTEVGFSLKIRGDLNDNGIVDINDVATIANMYVGNLPKELDITDFNWNGELDISEVSKLANYYVENIDEV